MYLVLLSGVGPAPRWAAVLSTTGSIANLVPEFTRNFETTFQEKVNFLNK
jgi:hypothetical protein